MISAPSHLPPSSGSDGDIMPKFVHLHLHTEYSLLDGSIRLKDLFSKAKEYGYDAVAITDHGTMHGVLNFYEAALKHGIKPILGCEVYVAPVSRFDRTAKGPKDAGYHLVLLAENNEGYKNLLKLASLAQFEGFYYKPRVDKELLRQYNTGLIALSACLHGEVTHHVVQEDMETAEQMVDEYASIFPNRFYLEIQENGIPEQAKANQGLMELAKRKGLPLVATCDCHYLDAVHASAHDVLLCIQTGKTVKDTNRMRFSTDQLYFAAPDELEKRFHYCPEALQNTVEIAIRCNVELDLKHHHFPRYPIEEHETYEELFDRKARVGLEKRIERLGLTETQAAEYRKRLEEELAVIKQKGFASYFLIVADFINWAKQRGIPVGPGRGSAAGSLTAYAMGITDLDPVRYGLYFERFLNPERPSFPDIDVDFCMNRRDEVLAYVTEKYGGEDYVAQIATFGQMKARAVIRDVGRGLGMPYSEVDKIAKLVPSDLGMTLEKALELEPKLRELVENDPNVAELWRIALALEGLPRHSSTHAAGVVISDKPMMEYLPLAKGQKGETVTQFDMKGVERVGLIKFDFLGLKTLTVIDMTLRFIKEQTGETIDLSNIPLDDEATYALLSSGDTTGVFQLESSGMKALIRSMRPSCFDDLIALVALYRPGPLDSGMVDQYVQAKHGKIQVKYLLPQLEPILKDTYGVIVYQEQVMKIAQELAGYSLGEGDLLRRAMGKKKPEEMAAQKERFLRGAKEKNLPLDKAEEIFELMAKFAGYGFNKSHSAAYALIAYQTAWLKTHYRVPFLAALLSNEMGNTDGVMKFIVECKKSNIRILPPDINRSQDSFTLDGDAIRFGLAAIKNVGAGALQAIQEERNANGPFKDFEDFCLRIDTRRVNKRVMESLIMCGAFDAMGHRRSQLFAALEQGLNLSQIKKKLACTIPSRSLFDDTDCAATEDTPEPRGNFLKLPDIPEWPEDELLKKEKDAIGFYISRHPLDSYADVIARVASHNTATLLTALDGETVSIVGLMGAIKEITTKKGDKMAFLTLEDLHGSVEVVCFPEAFLKLKQAMEHEGPLWIEGELQREKRDDDDEEREALVKILAKNVMDIKTITNKKAKAIKITLQADKTGPWVLDDIKQLICRYPGEYPVRITVSLPEKGSVVLCLPDRYKTSIHGEFLDEMQRILGYAGCSVDYTVSNTL